MINFFKNLFKGRKQQCNIPDVIGSTDYFNENYENEIEKCFFDSLKEVNMELDLNIRRIHHTSIFSKKHMDIFNRYNDEIESDNVEWNKYDGNVIMFYRPFRKIEYTKKHFYVKDMFGILT